MEATCVRLGNPVCVVWVESVDDAPVTTLGPLIEVHSEFPRGTNVAFAERVDSDHVRQRTWERGCGETRACGTGAGAVCVSGVTSGRTRRSIEVSLPGGALSVRWPEDDSEVVLTGPARVAYEGDLAWR